MKIIHLELIFITIIISLFFASPKTYQNSNMKKFLSKLGIADVPSATQFLEEEIEPILKEEPKQSIVDESLGEEVKEGEEEKKLEKETEKSVVNIKCLWVEKLDV